MKIHACSYIYGLSVVESISDMMCTALGLRIGEQEDISSIGQDRVTSCSICSTGTLQCHQTSTGNKSGYSHKDIHDISIIFTFVRESV